MNFLAHLYLTQDLSEEIAVGNFMADAVKGQKALLQYPEQVQIGIKIHRAIDEFTDAHPLFRQGTKRLHENYGKFASVIMDIYYDHILAVNWERFSDIPLQEFTRSQYKIMTKHKHILPDRTKQWLTYMKLENLLYNYANESKIEQVLGRMDRRTTYVSGMSTAIRELRLYKDELTQEFMKFFVEMELYLERTFFVDISPSRIPLNLV